MTRLRRRKEDRGLTKTDLLAIVLVLLAFWGGYVLLNVGWAQYKALEAWLVVTPPDLPAVQPQLDARHMWNSTRLVLKGPNAPRARVGDMWQDTRTGKEWVYLRTESTGLAWYEVGKKRAKEGGT